MAMKSSWELWRKVKDLINGLIGTPTDTDVSTDIVNLQTAVDAIDTNVSTASTTTTGTIVQDGATGTPTAVVCASANVNTFGAWVQVDASLSADSWICSISVTRQTTTVDASFVVEVGVGAGAAEVTKIRFSGGFGVESAVGIAPATVFTLPIPIKVAASARLAARVSNSDNNTVDYYVGVSYYQGLET